MGLSAALGRLAVAATHVLVVETPGHWVTRAAVERAALRRGWQLAGSPADADALVVCGTPGPELARLVEVVWQQLPGPRARVDVPSPSAAGDALDRVRAQLLDDPAQRRDAREREVRQQVSWVGDGDGDGDGDGEMAPEGIPLAEGGEDRDGLELDVLTVPLGPVLRYWPAGLVLRCRLQGDVVVAAEASVVDPELEPGPAPPAARRCDNLTSLLALAGWPDGAARARRARDLLLGRGDDRRAARALDDLRARVRSSALLRRSLRGVRPVPRGMLAEHGLPQRLGGDTHDRTVGLLDRACFELRGAEAETESGVVPVGALEALVCGLDLATARLVVASLDLDSPRADREAAGA